MKAARKRRITRKVWRIYHFQERYELPDDMRKCRMSSLEYTRDFVGDSGGDEAVSYHHQMNMLSNGDGLEFAQLYGIYRLLVNMSAKRSRAYRGFLLDIDNEPLNDSQIAALLHVDRRKMPTIMRKLASAKLLEQVRLPIFDLDKNKIPDNVDIKDRHFSARGRNRAEPGGNPLLERGRARTRAAEVGK